MLHLFQWKTLCIYAFGNIKKRKKEKKGHRFQLTQLVKFLMVE